MCPTTATACPIGRGLSPGINALNRRVITGKPLPKLDWSFTNGDGHVRLSVVSDIRPSRVNIWSANVEDARFPRFAVDER